MRVLDTVCGMAFYLPLGDGRFRSTRHTTGPWDARSQHGGPPSALLGRAVEQCAPRDDMVVARVTVELLGAVPVDEVEVRVRVTRPGRSVELVEAVMAGGGRDVARAQAWRIRRTEGAAVPSRAPAAPHRPCKGSHVLPIGRSCATRSACPWRSRRSTRTGAPARRARDDPARSRTATASPRVAPPTRSRATASGLGRCR